MQISITAIPSLRFPSQTLSGPTHNAVECRKSRTGSSTLFALTRTLVSKALKSNIPDNGRSNPRPSKIIKAMSTPGVLEETAGEESVQRLTPHDQWEWNSRHHWKHWHGLWTMWKPTEGPDIVKTYKSVRSLWPVDEERVHLYHRNQWYETSGEGPDINWESGPWAMYEYKHSLQDGIWHPNSLDHRIIQFPNGDLGWVQLALKPNDVKSVVFNELHFMPWNTILKLTRCPRKDWSCKKEPGKSLNPNRDTLLLTFMDPGFNFFLYQSLWNIELAENDLNTGFLLDWLWSLVAFVFYI